MKKNSAKIALYLSVCENHFRFYLAKIMLSVHFTGSWGVFIFGPYSWKPTQTLKFLTSTRIRDVVSLKPVVLWLSSWYSTRELVMVLSDPSEVVNIILHHLLWSAICLRFFCKIVKNV